MTKLMIFILFLTLISCESYNSNKKESHNDIIYPTYDNIILDFRVDSLLYAFIAEVNNDSSLYELHFIESGYENEYGNEYNTILFVATNPFKSNMSFQQKQRPLFYILRNNCKIYLYSGLNYIIQSDEHKLDIPEENTEEDWWAKKWTIDISDSEIRVLKKGRYPKIIDVDIEKEREATTWIKEESNIRK